MAFRYLIYSTGTTFAETIIRESATNNPGANEASLYSDFVIPQIQPLYLWRITGGTTVVPNTDSNISTYLQSIAPTPTPEDDATVGFVTGITSQKIDVVTGAVGNIGTFLANGNLEDSGYAIADLTGGTSYTFVGSGGTQVFEDGNQITIYSTVPSGTTVAWGDITGTLSAQTDLQNALNAKTDVSLFNNYTGTTDTRLQGIESDITYLSGQTDNKLNTTIFSTYTGTTQPVIDAALTGATNGLTPNGRNAELGGALTKDTSITGTAYGLTANTKNILLQAINGIDIIDTDGVGGINIESDAGTIALIGNTNLGSEQTKLEISETQMLITDSRATKIGLQYAGDYSTTFTNESLITKRYADAIAAGLIPKAAVLVATTANIVLSGLLTIDGITLQNGDRVLVKDQTSGATNGIYVAASGAWTRATDFDGNPSGEVSSGNLIPITSGNTQYNTLWVLVTPNPITIGVTNLDFTLFSSPHELLAGTGININGNTISVDGSSLAGNSISWTGNTFNVDITTGTLSTALNNKLEVTDFNTYSGTTVPATYLTINNFDTFTGTTLPANYYNKTEINTYTGSTATLIGNKLDTSIFNAYTGGTANINKKIQVVSTGTTDVNTVIATAIDWDSASPNATDIYSYTAGTTTIEILNGGDFEVQYHITLQNDGANQTHSVGAYLILTTGVTTTTLPITATAAIIVGPNTSGELSLPPVVLAFNTGDKLDLAGFRIGNSGIVNTVSGSVYLVLNKIS